LKQQLTIALDAMGGDLGPEMAVPGANLSAIRHPEARFLLFGDQARIAPIVERHPKLKQRCEIRHSDVSIAMDAKPSQALRQGRGKSSMWQSIDAVRKGEAQSAVSAGNTGALMAMSRFILKTLPGIARPAMAAIWPTLRSESIVLDVGATIGADANQLVEFAIMGEAMARCLFGVEKPSVGLLNIGVEEMKGVEQVKEAARLLRELRLPLEYAGFVEGDDIGKGTVDVVVTEGFTGNIALKTAEGTAKQLSVYLKLALARTMFSKLGAVLASGAFATLRDRMDPRKHNGGVFLGLNGVVVKSHGGTDALGFATAIDISIEMVRNDLVNKIKTDLIVIGHPEPSSVSSLMAPSNGSGGVRH
jgi:glycerol-3-phosphate acyltransferase PlsX